MAAQQNSKWAGAAIAAGVAIVLVFLFLLRVGAGDVAKAPALLDFGQYFALWTSPSDPSWIGESAPFTVGLGLPITIPVVIRRDVPATP